MTSIFEKDIGHGKKNISVPSDKFDKHKQTKQINKTFSPTVVQKMLLQLLFPRT